MTKNKQRNFLVVEIRCKDIQNCRNDQISYKKC